MTRIIDGEHLLSDKHKCTSMSELCSFFSAPKHIELTLCTKSILGLFHSIIALEERLWDEDLCLATFLSCQAWMGFAVFLRPYLGKCQIAAFCSPPLPLCGCNKGSDTNDISRLYADSAFHHHGALKRWKVWSVPTHFLRKLEKLLRTGKLHVLQLLSFCKNPTVSPDWI